MTPFVPLVRRRLAVTLAIGLALGLLAILSTTVTPRTSGGAASRLVPTASRVSAFTPVTGATFNRPTGTDGQQRRVLNHVNKTIDAVPRGSVIRIAVFSFAEKRTADALLRAKARGVKVRLIFDDHTIYPQERRLRKALGGNINSSSFVVYCSHSCRGTGGDMHDKIFLFKKAGHAHWVSMTGSNNITSFNAQHQWADVYTVTNDHALFSTYARLFAQMKRDRPMTDTYSFASLGDYQTQFLPDRVGEGRDPVMVTLSGVVCTGAASGTGSHGMTRIRVVNHAWYGARGLYIARRFAELAQEGCRIQVIPGITMAKGVRTTLTDAGIPLAVHTHKGIYAHEKVLQISGNLWSDPGAQMVFTGSQNYSDRSLTNDDNILRIDGSAAAAAYAKNFRYIWNHY